MAEVTGRIGDNDVSLDNAATETTLRALLLATTKSTKEMDKLLKLAAKAGMNPRDIEAANAAMKSSAAATMASSQSATGASKSLNVLNKGLAIAGGVLGSLTSSALSTTKNFVGFADQLLQGQTSVASFALAFKDLPLGLGLLASVIGKVIAMQEEELETYRKLTSAGVNFAGDLTGIRQNALNLGLTLDQFGNLMTNNTEVLARFGDTANEGAKNFVKIASTLKNSPIGQQLLAMGVGFEQLSQGVMNYMKISANAGGTQVKDTKAMTEAAGAYIKQQDMLARLTGRSVEEQQKILEKESANAAWRNYLLTLNTTEREKAEHAYNDALQKGGVGAADALRSRMMKIPPMTEAGALFESLAENTSAEFAKLDRAIKDPTISLKDLQTSFDAVTFALGKDGEKFAGPVGAALIAGAGELGNQVSKFLENLNRNIEQGMTSLDAVTRRRIEQEQKQAELQSSNAGLLAKAQDDLRKIGAGFLEALGPALSKLTPIIKDLVTEFTKIVNDNMPAIERGVKIFADKLKEVGQNLFTEDGRQKLINDIKFFFEDIMIDIKQSLKVMNKDEAEQARREIEARRKESDVKAAAALAIKNAENAAKQSEGIQKDETVEQARQRLQAAQDAKQKAIDEAQAAVEKAQAERAATVIDVSTPDAVARQDAINRSQMTIGENIVTGIARAIEIAGSGIDKVIGTELGESARAARVLGQSVTLRKEGRQTGTETAPVEPTEQLDYSRYFPGMSEGGIATGPDSGYLALLHGTEAVIPLGNSKPTKENLPDILLNALSNMGKTASKVLDVPAELKDMIKKTVNPEAEIAEETEVTKSVIESNKQLENVAELLVKLNTQTAEMLEHIKISAEYDRRNLDALNEINPNAFIRA